MEGRWLQDSVYQNSKLKFLGGLKYGSSIRSQVSKCMGELFRIELVRIWKIGSRKTDDPSKECHFDLAALCNNQALMFLDFASTILNPEFIKS